MKKIIFIILLFSVMNVSSQVNLDSLVNTIRTSQAFSITDSVHYTFGDFVKFENTSKTQRFDICLDSAGNICSNLRVALIQLEYDSIGRKTLTKGYNIDGTFNLWDFPPIELISYRSDSIITNVYSHSFTLKKRTIEKTDSQGRVLIEKQLDGNLNFISGRSYSFDKVNFKITSTAINAQDQAINDQYGISKTQIFVTNFSDNHILKQFFYDKDMKLVDGYHKHQTTYGSNLWDAPSERYAYFLITRGEKPFDYETSYFNSNNKLIGQTIYGEFMYFE